MGFAIGLYASLCCLLNVFVLASKRVFCGLFVGCYYYYLCL